MALYAERTPYDDSIYYITDPVTGEGAAYNTRGLTYFEQDPYARAAIADYHNRIGFFNPETGGPWWDMDYFGTPRTTRQTYPWRQPAYQDPEYFQRNAGNLSMDDLRRVIMAIEMGTIAGNDPVTLASGWLQEQQAQQDAQAQRPSVNKQLQANQQAFWNRVAAKREAAGQRLPFSGT